MQKYVQLKSFKVQVQQQNKKNSQYINCHKFLNHIQARNFQHIRYDYFFSLQSSNYVLYRNFNKYLMSDQYKYQLHKIKLEHMEDFKRKRQLKIDEIRENMMSTSPVIRRNHDRVNRALSLNLFNAENINETENNHEQQNILRDLSLFELKYEIGEKLGQGSDGVVHKCKRKLDEKIFAVKAMMMDDEQLHYLAKNFKFMKNVHHSAIVKYQALYMDLCKHKAYLVMQYIPYPTLTQICPCTNEHILKPIFYQLFDALSYLHKMNICHRDIKPDNIAFDAKTNQIKLIDFGISNQTICRGQKKSLLTLTGTLYYRAPQMFMGGGYDEKVDIWAAGISLYEMLVGKTPFQSLYHSEAINKIMTHELNMEAEQCKNISSNANDLIKKLISPIQDRLSARQALKHPWFLENQNLRKYFDEQQGLFSELSTQDGQSSPVVYYVNKRCTLFGQMKPQVLQIQDFGEQQSNNQA